MHPASYTRRLAMIAPAGSIIAKHSAVTNLRFGVKLNCKHIMLDFFTALKCFGV
jgi:hypothetical protein